AAARQPAVAESRVVRVHQRPINRLQNGAAAISTPRPRVSEPQRGQHMQWRASRSTVCGGHAEDDIGRIELGGLDDHIEVAVVVKHSSVEELVFWRQPATPSVGMYQVSIWERALWVLVEGSRVGMSGCAVEIEVVLLDIFTMVAFGARQSKQALLEDWV